MVPRRILLYHITHINNLAPIVRASGLKAYKDLRQSNTGYTNIAYQHIQDRRATKAVPCGPCGTLHDYVPFYFAARSPMLYTINQGNVAGYAAGQHPVVHLVTSLEHILNAGVPFVFTDGHGTMELTEFFDDPAHLSRIDWDVMQSQYWHDTNDDPDRKRRRQAEFLVHAFVPWQLIIGVGVIDDVMKVRAEQTMQAAEHQPPVKVLPNWYY